MQSRKPTDFIANPTKAHAGFAGIAILLIVSVLLCGCQSAPPVRPTAPSQVERQVQTLQSLGFRKTDDGWLLNLPAPIWFEFDSATLKPDMQHNIAGVAEQLLKVEIGKLRVEGHTDNIGPRQINLELSQRRAATVAKEFIAHGFVDGNVERIGYGPDHPDTSNDTREGRAQNRRVEVIVPLDALALTQN